MHILDTGILNQSEPGTLRATLSFPTIAALSNGTLLAACRSGADKDSADGTIEFCRSTDGGATWSAPHRPFGSTLVRGVKGSLRVCNLTEHALGKLIAGIVWIDRETYPGRGLFNPDTEGCLPMAILLADSEDFGETWSPLRDVPMPEEFGPAGITNPILPLADGSMAMSVEESKSYEDDSRWMQRVVMFHSTDAGRTWGPPSIAGFDPTGRIFNWDLRTGVAPDGRVVTFAWTYNSETREYLNVHRRISTDNGRTWSPAEDLGFTDQAGHPAILPDGRVVLPWVDRFGTQTIRARVAPSVDAPFEPESEVVIYRHREGAISDTDQAGALGLAVWSFGLPFADPLPNGDVLVVYYAGTETEMDIHWARIRVDG